MVLAKVEVVHVEVVLVKSLVSILKIKFQLQFRSLKSGEDWRNPFVLCVWKGGLAGL